MHVIDIIVNNYYTTNSHFAWADQARARILVVLESALQQLTRNSLYDNRACISIRSELRKDPKLTACSHAETTSYWNNTFMTSVTWQPISQ